MTGRRQVDGAWHYFRVDDGCEVQSKFVLTSAAGGVAYYGTDGSMCLGTQRLYGYVYHFDEQTGTRAEESFVSGGADGVTTYYDDLGHMVTGQRTIGGDSYYFKSGDGAMAASEFVTLERRVTCYYNEQGKMLHGDRQIDGKWYHLDESTGARIENGVVAAKGESGSYYYYNSKGERTGSKLSAAARDSVMQVIDSCKSTPSPGAGLCAAWVTNVLNRAGLGYYGGDACDLFYSWCKSSNEDDLRPGMIVAVPTHAGSYMGQLYGHVAYFIGANTVMDNYWGQIRTLSFDQWVNDFGTTMKPQWGWLGGVVLK